MIKIAILGSTGSVGEQTLSVLRQHRELFDVCFLTCNSNAAKVLEQAAEFDCPNIAIADSEAAKIFRESNSPSMKLFEGEDAVLTALTEIEPEYVVAGIMGAAGLRATIKALSIAKRVILANKESLVIAGDVFMAEAKKYSVELIPIDSEHNAIFQSLPEGRMNDDVRRILLTGSGGPFFSDRKRDFNTVTPKEACGHPKWKMGKKISVDSATMMNKGLELIEACYLFEKTPAEIEVLIHPEVVVHSMVEFRDGSVIGQMGCNDLRIPIANALAWPRRITSGASFLQLVEIGQLNFFEPDHERFPCLKLAEAAFNSGGTALAYLNAANEVAVHAFLNNKLSFNSIPRIVEEVLSKCSLQKADSLELIIAADRQARKLAYEFVRNHSVA